MENVDAAKIQNVSIYDIATVGELIRTNISLYDIDIREENVTGGLAR